HAIKIQLLDDDVEVIASTASEVNSIIFSYALTVHKSQGAEWNKVFLLIHHSHATMLQRELLYTACTRAKEKLIIFCDKDNLEKGIERQRIKGRTLKEKAEFFKGKYEKEEIFNI